jgi:single-strand DNA-binding protein
VWSPIAEVVEKYVKKGSKVLVQGKVKYRSWQDKDGATRYATEIEVREVILLDSKEKAVELGGGGKSAEQNRDPNDFKDMPEALDAEDDDLPY